MPLNTQACKGKWLTVIVTDPPSVCCDDSLMVCALRTVGVKPHPGFGFLSYVKEVGGKQVRFWRWILSEKSVDGKYETATLVRWWKDADWIKGNPAHEFAIVAAALKNMGVQAAEVRSAVPRLIVQRGRSEAQIPANASPARKQHIIDKLERRLPMDAKFEEPAAAS